MATDLSQHILDQVRQLSPDEQRELLVQIQRGLGEPIPTPPGRSILELQGLGKEVWAGVDVAQYLRHERASWNG